MNNSSITLTISDSAAKHLNKELSGSNTAYGIRIATTTSGCSGFSYRVSLAETLARTDMLGDVNGVPVIINKTDLSRTNDLQIDYTHDTLGSSLTYSNPNFTAICGCKQSFAIE